MKLARIVAFVALAASAAVAQDWRGGTGRLEGRVLDASGKPIEGALVRLELPGRGGTEVRTDAKGRWAILGLAAGDWTVELSAPGFVSRRATLSVGQHERRPPYEGRLDAVPGPPPEVTAALAEARAAEKEGRLAPARAAYERLRAMRPELGGRIDQQIGLTYVREGDYERGLDYLERALRAEPDSVPLRAAAIQAAFQAGRAARGKELLASVEPALVRDPDIAFNFGIDLVNAGDTRPAISWFTRAINLDPGYVDGYYRRALARLQLGEAAECRADFSKVVELAPGTAQGEMARKALDQVRLP